MYEEHKVDEEVKGFYRKVAKSILETMSDDYHGPRVGIENNETYITEIVKALMADDTLTVTELAMVATGAGVCLDRNAQLEELLSKIWDESE